METVLVSGGAGYIGSHACVALMEAGFQVVVLDNFSNSHPEVFNRLERITGMTRDDAKKFLIENMVNDAKAEGAQEVKAVRDEAKVNARKELHAE